MKKITIISSYFAPAWAYGGPPQVLFTLANQLADTNIAVDVLTTDSLGQARSKVHFEENGKVKIYRFKNLSNSLAFRANFFYAPEAIPKSRKILADAEYVLFSDVRNIFNWQFIKYVKEKSIPYGIFAFGEIPYGKGIKSIVKKLFDLLWVKDFIENAKWLFAQNEHEIKMYEQYFKAEKLKIHLLPLPVETKTSNLSFHQIAKFRKKIDIKQEEKIILFVGRINYLKGIDILVKSVEKLLRVDRQLKLLIVGRDDGYLKRLLSVIPTETRKQIIFPGPIYDNDLDLAYAISDCFVITPRFYEETSTASLQALACGVPVVVTRQAEVPYFLDYQAGFIVEDNPKQIEDAVGRIIYSTSKEKAFRRLQAKKCIFDHFSAEKVTKQLLQLISK